MTGKNAQNDSNIEERFEIDQRCDTTLSMPELVITKEGILSKLLDLKKKKCLWLRKDT